MDTTSDATAGSSTLLAVNSDSYNSRFDPTKLHKRYIVSDESEGNFFFEEFSKEGLLCQLCGETFHTQKSLSTHMKLHSQREENHSTEKQRYCAETGPFFDEDDDDASDGEGGGGDSDGGDGEMKKDKSTSRKVYKPRRAKYECSICYKRFSSKETVREHIKIHTEEAPYQCPLCEKHFSSGNLYRHLTVTHKECDERTAELCTKAIQEVPSQSHENHMLEFTGEKSKPYRCGICSKVFKRLYRVKNHIRSHTGQKPFQCSVCSKVFSASDYLTRHVKKCHNRGVPIPKMEKTKVEEPEMDRVKDLGIDTTMIQIQDGSGSTFSIPLQQSSTNELTFLHNARQEGDVFTIEGDGMNGTGQTYYIDLRNSDFTSAQHVEVQVVQDHTEIHQHLPDHDEHGENDDNDDQQLTEAAIHSQRKAFQCSICGESFFSSHLLNRHISTHRFEVPCKCHICGKVLKKESYLDRHMLIHTDEKPFQCKFCPKAFKLPYRLTNHLRSHTGERPYSCSVCNKTFAVSDHLRKHIKKIHKGVGLEYAVALVKQVQDMQRKRESLLRYAHIEASARARDHVLHNTPL